MFNLYTSPSLGGGGGELRGRYLGPPSRVLEKTTSAPAPVMESHLEDGLQVPPLWRALLLSAKGTRKVLLKFQAQMNMRQLFHLLDFNGVNFMLLFQIFSRGDLIRQMSEGWVPTLGCFN